MSQSTGDSQTKDTQDDSFPALCQEPNCPGGRAECHTFATFCDELRILAKRRLYSTRDTDEYVEALNEAADRLQKVESVLERANGYADAGDALIEIDEVLRGKR